MSKPKKLVWLPLAYAALITLGSLILLIGIGRFDYGDIVFETPGAPILNILVVAVLICALPFLLGLKTTEWFKKISFVAALIGPYSLLAGAIYLLANAKSMIIFGYFILSALLALLSIPGVIIRSRIDR